MLAEELREPPSPIVEALLTRTVRAAERMGRMLDQSMEYGASREQPSFVEVDLAQAGRAAGAQLLRPARGHRCRRRGGRSARRTRRPGRPVLRAAEPAHQLGQVRRPGVPLRACTSRPGAWPDGWRISVRDNGVGHPGGATGGRLLAVQPGLERRRGARHRPGHGRAHHQRPRRKGGCGVRCRAAAAEIWFELPDDEDDARDERTPAPNGQEARSGTVDPEQGPATRSGSQRP